MRSKYLMIFGLALVFLIAGCAGDEVEDIEVNGELPEETEMPDEPDTPDDVDEGEDET